MKFLYLTAALGLASSTQAIQLERNNWTGYDPDAADRVDVDKEMKMEFYMYANKTKTEAPKVWQYDIMILIFWSLTLNLCFETPLK